MKKKVMPVLLSSLFISPVFAGYVPYSAPEKEKTLVGNTPISNAAVSDPLKDRKSVV